jgi:hypothetical protein
MTVGYSSAKDPAMVRKWTVTITAIEPVNVYNALGASLVGPLARVEHKGERVTFIDDETGSIYTIVEPPSSHYALKAGDRAVYIVDRGQVWLQPVGYPLPPEFSQ